MASPEGGPPRSGACLARHQRLRFYFILISDGKSEVKSVGELKMGFLKMENKKQLFFQITEVRRREMVHVRQACGTRSCSFLEGNKNVCVVSSPLVVLALI